MFFFGKCDTWEFYQDRAEQWRWRRFAFGGMLMGSSHMGYCQYRDCITNATFFGFIDRKRKKFLQKFRRKLAGFYQTRYLLSFIISVIFVLCVGLGLTIQHITHVHSIMRTMLG